MLTQEEAPALLLVSEQVRSPSVGLLETPPPIIHWLPLPAPVPVPVPPSLPVVPRWLQGPLNLEGVEISSAKGRSGAASLAPLSLKIGPGNLLVAISPDRLRSLVFSRLLLGLDRLGHGRILLNRQNMSKLSLDELAGWRQSGVGVVSDEPVLWKSLSLLDNLVLPTYSLMPGYPDLPLRLADELLHQASLYAYRDHMLSALNPEQQAVVGLLAALVKAPRFLIYHTPPTLPKAAQSLIWRLLENFRTAGGTLIVTANPRQHQEWLSQGDLPTDYQALVLSPAP